MRVFHRNHLGMLQAVAHQRLMQRALGDRQHIAGLIEVCPGANGSVAASGDGQHITDHVRLGENEMFLAFWSDADCKHGDVAAL